MTGGWKTAPVLGSGTDIATQSGASQGTSIPGSGSSTFAKGAWTQLIASTANDAAWMLISAETGNSGGAALAVDIGVGGSGNEIAIISNLAFAALASTGAFYSFPVAIPAGSRVAARMSSSNLFDQMPVQVLLFADTYSSTAAGGPVDTYGFNAASNTGTQIDPGGSANTKGSYSQISSSTTADLAGFSLYFDARISSTGSAGEVSWLVDIAVGGAGSEKVIVPNLFLQGFLATNSSSIFMPATPYLPIPVPAASRFAARAQCSTATSPDRLIGITVYGVRQ